VALLRGDLVLSSAAHDSLEEYSSWLLPAVQGILADASVGMTEVDLYAVAAGPGSFTGVRVGLTTAKAWAEVYAKPIAGVSRLEAIALEAAGGAKYAAAWADARRGQVFGALYRIEEQALCRVGEEMVLPLGKFIETVADLSAGERVSWATTDPAIWLETEQRRAGREFQESLAVVSPHLAVAIARIGIRQARKGQVVDALALDANYVRRSDAEMLWKAGGKSAAEKQ
jgi:tRNA threonylcarbamoyladenosine biosynthesis protein TsaB